MNGSTFCSILTDIPTELHYVILTERQTYIPGDERSRTHPGHGYGEGVERSFSYQSFLDRKEWEAEIKRRIEGGKGPRDWRALVVQSAQISTETTVKIRL